MKTRSGENRFKADIDGKMKCHWCAIPGFISALEFAFLSISENVAPY